MQIKPDGVQRGMIADIIKRFESKGYKLVAIKAGPYPQHDLAFKHMQSCGYYAHNYITCSCNENCESPILEGLQKSWLCRSSSLLRI